MDQWFLTHFESSTVAFGDIVWRILLATLLGGLIGLDREWRNRPAGLRTHMLVSLAAATFALLMLEILANPAFSDDNVRIDPIRILEAVTAGVAFLAAGAIIQSRGQVRGLTTGAGLWLAGALGAAAGLGYAAVAVPATVVGMVVITGLRLIEPQVSNKSGSAKEEDRNDEK